MCSVAVRVLSATFATDERVRPQPVRATAATQTGRRYPRIDLSVSPRLPPRGSFQSESYPMAWLGDRTLLALLDEVPVHGRDQARRGVRGEVFSAGLRVRDDTVDKMTKQPTR